MKPKGPSLTLKIFLGTAAVVVLIVGATLAIAYRQAARAADASVDRVLGSAREAVNAQLAGSASGMLEAARAFAENPGFRAIVESRLGGDVLDQAVVAATSLSARWVQITDREGVRLAKSDEPGADAVDMSGSPDVQAALGLTTASAYGVTADNTLLQVAAVPVEGAGRTAVGALLAARAVDSSFAAQLKREAASDLEVVFFTTDAGGSPVIAGSTLGRGADVMGTVAAAVTALTDSSEMRLEADLRGTHWVGLAEALRSSSGDPVGGYLMLRDRNAEFADFAALQRSLLLSGGLGILLAAILALALANQITRPVAALVQATRRAADGDYAAEIPATSRDEIGVLAAAFRGLLGDLREKQQLVEFLSAAEQGRTMPLRAMSATSEQRNAAIGLVPGQRFAQRYEVKEVLGEGGMGTVFKAVDTELGEVIAIKTLRKDFLTAEPTALERFKSEIRLARRISHRNVVRTHDLGEDSGIYFITMEYVEGKSLKELVRARGKLPLPVVLSVGKQLARALEVAHEQGVIHRDVKPQNMVVEADGVLKVMDFGIARLATRAPEAEVTQAGAVVGTPEYMAPEQVSGQAVDQRADIYATGCVLYECLTGRTPLTATTPWELIAKLLEERPAPVRALNPEVPPALDALVMQCLAKDPAERPQTAAALHDALALIG